MNHSDDSSLPVRTWKQDIGRKGKYLLLCDMDYLYWTAEPYTRFLRVVI